MDARRRLLLLAPLGIAAAGGAAFWAMLDRMEKGSFDPRAVPSPLVGKPMPDFALPAQPPGEGFSSADIRAAGTPVVVNFFASWCIPCIEEAQTLMALRRRDVPLWGIAYKDKTEDAARFLERYGNPFVRLARDEPGRVAIDFGLYGVPETYLIDRQGIVRWRWAGGLAPETVEQVLMPLLKTYA